MGALGAGLLGAAGGALGVLSKEYESINEERGLIRKEERAETRDVAKEARLNAAKLAIEERFAKAEKIAFDYEEGVRVKNARDTHNANAESDAARAAALEQEEIDRAINDPGRDPNYLKSKATTAGSNRANTEEFQHRKAEGVDPALGRGRQAPVPYIGSKVASDSVMSQTMAQFGLTTEDLEKLDVQDDPSTRIVDGKSIRATQKAFTGEKNQRLLRAQVAYSIANGERVNIDKMAKGQQIKDEEQLTEMAQGAAARADFIVNEWQVPVNKLGTPEGKREAKAEYDRMLAENSKMTQKEFVLKKQQESAKVIDQILGRSGHTGRAGILKIQREIDQLYWQQAWL